MSKFVAVVDYGIGNIFSVCNALLHLGASPVLTDDPKVVERADRVILPGVGAFSHAIKNLQDRGLHDAVLNFVRTGRPFLGVCVGMQLLMEQSTEFGLHDGLALVPGKVEHIKSFAKGRVKLPHIGWAEVKNCSDRLVIPTCSGEKDQSYFYFVHSFVCRPADVSDIVASVSYGGSDLVAVIKRDNIMGVQFHPERSGANGLKFLGNFLES